MTRGWHEDRDDRAVRDGERACEDFYGDDGNFAFGVCVGLLLVAPLWAVVVWACVQAVTAW